MTTLVLIDDHAILRSGIKLLLTDEPDFEIVGEAESAEEARGLLLRTKPNVALLDVTLKDGSSIKKLRELRASSPDTRILMLTMHDDQSLLRAALAEGAAGYIGKHAASEELIAAIRTVSRGRTYISVSADSAAHLIGTRLSDVPRSVLSKRESEVLVLLAEGHTAKEAAEKLGVSKKTVDTYRARIKEKLDLASRAELVRYARETGLLAS